MVRNRRQQSGLSIDDIARLSSLVHAATNHEGRKATRAQSETEEANMHRLVNAATFVEKNGSTFTNNGPLPKPVIDFALSQSNSHENTFTGVNTRQDCKKALQRHVSPLTPQFSHPQLAVGSDAAASSASQALSQRPDSIDWSGLLRLVDAAQDYYQFKPDTAELQTPSTSAMVRVRNAGNRTPPISERPISQTSSSATTSPQASKAQLKGIEEITASATGAETPATVRKIVLKTATQASRPRRGSPAIASISSTSRSSTPARSGVKRKVTHAASASPRPSKSQRKSSRRPQLGNDPSRPGLIILKLTLTKEDPDGDNSKIEGKGTTRKARKLEMRKTRSRIATPPPLVGSRPIDLTPQSKTGDCAFVVPHANADSLSKPRERLLRTVQPHLLEGMRYLATHQCVIVAPLLRLTVDADFVLQARKSPRVVSVILQNPK